MRWIIENRRDLLIGAIVLIAGLKLTSGLEKALDIGLYDESVYMYRGVTLTSVGLRRAEEAPLYAIWYFILSIIEPNRISLYFLNYKLMAILPPVFIYILLRRYRVSIPVSFIISWSILLSRANADSWPRVSHLAMIVIFSILIAVSFTRSLIWASLFASLGALLVSYIRPEYFLLYPPSVLFFIFALIQEYRKQKKLHITALTAYMLISILLLGVLGVPISGNRSIVAFGQHFSINWVSWTGTDINPFTNWQEILSLNFGSDHSIWEALVGNPVAFLKHITFNLPGIIRRSATLILPTSLPDNKLSKGVAALLIIGLSVANVSNIRKNFLEHKRPIILIGVFILPALVSVVIIYPRDHYILMLYMLTVVLMTILLDGHAIKHRQERHKQLK